MPTIDAQVHAYERNHPGRPWVAALHGPPEVTGDQMVAAMDAVGVDGAMLVSPFSLYRYDASYALEVHAQAPRPVRPGQAGRSERPGGGRDDRRVGGHGRRGRRAHHAERDVVSTDPADPGLNRVLAAAARALAAGQPAGLGPAGSGRRAGRAQPGHAAGDRPSRAAAAVRAAAARRALRRPAEGAGAGRAAATSRSRSPAPARCRTSRSRTRTSGTRSARIFDAFGLDRCLWGTDWTRAVALLTYEQGVEAFRVTDRLSDSDRATLMGGALTRVYNWSPKA